MTKRVQDNIYGTTNYIKVEFKEVLLRFSSAYGMLSQHFLKFSVWNKFPDVATLWRRPHLPLSCKVGVVKTLLGIIQIPILFCHSTAGNEDTRSSCTILVLIKEEKWWVGSKDTLH